MAERKRVLIVHGWTNRRWPGHWQRLTATALRSDLTYANQLKAAGILENIFQRNPNHPGVAHYLIHSYDAPAIADKGMPAARRYADFLALRPALRRAASARRQAATAP